MQAEEGLSADGELKGNSRARGIGSMWNEVKDPEGRTYYHNTVSQSLSGGGGSQLGAPVPSPVF